MPSVLFRMGVTVTVPHIERCCAFGNGVKGVRQQAFSSQFCNADVHLKPLDPKKCIRQGKIGSPVCAQARGLLRRYSIAWPQHEIMFVLLTSLA